MIHAFIFLTLYTFHAPLATSTPHRFLALFSLLLFILHTQCTFHTFHTFQATRTKFNANLLLQCGVPLHFHHFCNIKHFFSDNFSLKIMRNQGSVTSNVEGFSNSSDPFLVTQPPPAMVGCLIAIIGTCQICLHSQTCNCSRDSCVKVKDNGSHKLTQHLLNHLTVRWQC